jgi:transcriptional regulator with XRE-family HTH domain
MAMPTTAGRPVFYPALGKYFISLREGRGWSQGRAAINAAKLGLDVLSKDVIARLEEGKTKFPEQEVLRSIAELYGVPYREVAERFIAAAYDLPFHGGTTASASDEAPASTRVLDLARAEVQQQIDDTLERLDVIQESLGSVVATLRARPKPDGARRHQARPRRLHR